MISRYFSTSGPVYGGKRLESLMKGKEYPKCIASALVGERGDTKGIVNAMKVS